MNSQMTQAIKRVSTIALNNKNHQITRCFSISHHSKFHMPSSMSYTSDSSSSPFGANVNNVQQAQQGHCCANEQRSMDQMNNMNGANHCSGVNNGSNRGPSTKVFKQYDTIIDFSG